MDSNQPLSVIDAGGQPRAEFTCGLSDDELMRCFTAMLAVRSFDDMCMKLQRGGRIGFSVPNRGVEATQVGSAAALEPDDYIFPSYRDFGMAMYMGVKPVDMFHNMFGNAKDSAQGRQMPVHFSFVEPIHFFSISSPIGTQLPQAVGAAHAFQLQGKPHAVLTSFGDGGTSSSGFHSGLNLAGVLKAPVVFLCQNNGWAISCPSSKQTASENYAIKASAYGMPGVKVDGNDVLAVHQAVSEALERARAGGGPSLIEAETYRMGGHSTSDDPSKYVPKETLEKWADLDPIKRLRGYLNLRGLWTQEWEDELVARLASEHASAAKEAESETPPALESIFSDVFEALPAHLRRQGEAVFDLARRKGDAAAGDGAFPL